MSSAESMNDLLLRAVRKGSLTKIKELVLAHSLSRSKNWSFLLCDAVKSNKFEIVKFLLQEGAEVNCREENGDTPLHLAAAIAEPELAQLLIIYNADINAINLNGETPLHLAVENGNENVVRLLCNEAPYFIADKHGFDALGVACSKHMLEIVKILLDFDITPHSINTALIIASQEGDERIVASLLEANADPNICAESNLYGITTTPLLEACKSGSLRAVRLLLEYGAFATCSSYPDNYTPLHIASEVGDFGIVEALLNSGACINVKADNDATPLLIAAQKGCLNVVQVLIKHGARVNYSGERDMYTPLHVAAAKGHTEVVKELLNYSADPNARTCNGSTPLHFASRNVHVPTVEALLEFGANVNFKDRNNHDPLYFALKRQDSQLIHLLLKHKPNLSPEVMDLVTDEILSKDFPREVDWIDIFIALSHTADCEVGLLNVLLAVVKKGRLSSVQIFLGNSGHPNKEKFCAALLHEAVKNGHLDIVELLLKSGLDANVEDESGHSPLFYACDTDKSVCLKLVQMLIDHGGDIKSAPRLLCKATLSQSKELCQLLIRNGADLNYRIEDGKTALLIAIVQGAKDIFNLLIEAGADVNLCDQYGVTPLSLAICLGDKTVINTLLNCKACSIVGYY